jgi:hypothetical protein
MTMVERAAKAVFDLLSEDGYSSEFVFMGPVDFEETVKTVLLAMREPTEAMIMASMITPSPTVAEAGGIVSQARQHTRLEWQAMIDAALTEGTER